MAAHQGAKNVPSRAVAEDGTFKTAVQLRDIYEMMKVFARQQRGGLLPHR
ncbi:MAG: hypothetical protein R3D55_00865 [Chloroflexota bacterium]